MAANPIQLVLQQMMQQATQNPQVLMQLASSPPAQSFLQMLLSPQQMQNETTPFSGYPNATPLSRPMGGGTPYPIGDEDDPEEMNAALFNEIMDDKQRQAPHYDKPKMDLHRRIQEMRDLEDRGEPEAYPDSYMQPDDEDDVG